MEENKKQAPYGTRFFKKVLFQFHIERNQVGNEYTFFLEKHRHMRCFLINQ